MLKRIKWPGWLVLIFLLSVLFFTLIQPGFKAIKEEESEVKTRHESMYPGLNLETKTSENAHYSLATSTIITDSETINKEIQAWIQAQQEEFLGQVEENEELLINGRRAHLNISAEISEISDKFYSLIFTSYQIAGGANGKTIVFPLTINVDENKVLHLEDILKIDDNQKNISSIIKEQITQNHELNQLVMEDLLDEALKEPNTWKWSLSKDTFTIYFDEYEIAAGAAGLIKVDIPMKKIAPYLHENISIELGDSIEIAPPEEVTPDVAELDPEGKYVALTFDDGPSPKVTPEILKTLEEFDVKATFFMLGSQAEFYPTVAQSIVKSGHEIGNHTKSHIDLSTLANGKIKEEINSSNQMLKEITGQYPSVFRPPYGSYNTDVVEILADENIPLVLWSVDSLDWKSRNATSIVEEVQENIVPGSIILMHDIHSSTAEALPTLLAELEKEGYEFITVSQLLSIQEEEGVGPHFGNYH